MASTSEVGHGKNAANFSSLYQILEEMGALYNPSNTKIQLANLEPIKGSLATVIQTLNDKKPLYKNAVVKRETTIAVLGKTSSNVLNAFKSLDVTTHDKENIASIVKKIRGDKKSIRLNPDTTSTEGISTSQMSYDSRIANLGVLISALNSHSLYHPNEDSIKTQRLLFLQQSLITESQEVNATGNALITARKDRNDILYYNTTNVVQLTKDIKAYLKSLGEGSLPYYKAAVKLIFTSNQ
jgi:hypothetical protein